VEDTGGVLVEITGAGADLDSVEVRADGTHLTVTVGRTTRAVPMANHYL